MKSFIFSALILSFAHAGAGQKESVDIIKALFPDLGKTKSSIKTSGCKLNKQKWAQIVLTNKSFMQEFKFAPQCDLEGKFKVEMSKYFPVQLKIKDFKRYTQIKTMLKMSISFEQMPLLTIEMKQAKLSGKKNNIRFYMRYGVYVQPLNKNPFAKHKGGHLYLIDQKKKFPLKF